MVALPCFRHRAITMHPRHQEPQFPGDVVDASLASPRGVGHNLWAHVIPRRAMLSQSNYKPDRLEDPMNLELELSYRAEVKLPVTENSRRRW
jgi:hypothetical protein